MAGQRAWLLHGPLRSSPSELPNSGFVDFMLDQTQGFMHAGVERLNDSIRTYVWAILGAQDKERTPILGYDTAFTAIQQAEETPITKYQSVLQLYMCPSDRAGFHQSRGRPSASYQWYASALFWLSSPTSLSAQRLLGLRGSRRSVASSQILSTGFLVWLVYTSRNQTVFH